MAITKRNPNRIFLGGEPKTPTVINELAAKEAITPGMLCDMDTTTGVTRWKKAATAKSPTTSVALDLLMLNKGVDDACAIGDLIEVAELVPGQSFLGIIASGANITAGDKLENAGNGKLRAWTDASRAFRAVNTVNNSAGPSDARIIVEVL
jgi:hypothetical protein